MCLDNLDNQAKKKPTIREGEPAEEWLVIRHEYSQQYTYALSNVSADALLRSA
jgi:hypothetical protein